MGVDKSYGSGKSRSAANSAARRTKAGSANLRKKNIKKVASRPFQKQAVAAVGKQAAAGFNIGGRQYLETGVSANKILTAANALRSIGQGLFPATRALSSRVAAKEIGRTAATNIARSRYLAENSSRELSPVAKMLPTMFKTEAKAAGSVARAGARSLFPQAQQAAQEARLAKVRLAVAKKANRNR